MNWCLNPDFQGHGSIFTLWHTLRQKLIKTHLCALVPVAASLTIIVSDLINGGRDADEALLLELFEPKVKSY